jgi:hypothetical protein
MKTPPIKRFHLPQAFVTGLLIMGILTGLPGLIGESDSAQKPADGVEGAGGRLSIELALRGADTEQGILLRPNIENQEETPYALGVCPFMLICCVQGAHVYIRDEDWGIGLLDVCSARKPSQREVLLPANASFTFDVRVPMERLPEGQRTKGKKLEVRLCYELGEETLIWSNPVLAVIR